jgi:hypothetical protein
MNHVVVRGDTGVPQLQTRPHQVAGREQHQPLHPSKPRRHQRSPRHLDQHILDSGNTSCSGTPHLHLELKLNDQRVCPQPLLSGLYARAVGAFFTAPDTSCSY